MQQQPDREQISGAVSAAELRERIVQLEREVAELRKSRDEAEQLSNMKSAVLTNLSHEIRTPLAAIVGFASILQEELTDRHQKFLDFIERSGKRLMDALNSILNLSMLEEGNYRLRSEVVDVVQQIEEEISGLKRTASDKHLELRVRYATDVIMATIDRTALDRVVHNLLENAIRFTDTGSVEMDVVPTGTSLELRITDTGHGVRPEFQPLMFDAFAQEADSAHSYEGVGLGLTITKRLVDLMGGTIEVASAIGKGSTFTVMIPDAIQSPTAADTVIGNSEAEVVESDVTDAVADRRVPKVTTPDVTSDESVAKPSVMAVEDNPDMLILLQHLLSSRCEVSTASNGRTALELARANNFDAILMDINLGEDETGVDVMLKIREIAGYRETPIVAVTAYALPGDRERFLQAGFDGYIGKPFTKQQLFRMMDQVLAKSSA
ncbi:MAG: response regulator [Rhodothermales bacterium]|nr:response regulator [Rhodothermales bacterium]